MSPLHAVWSLEYTLPEVCQYIHRVFLNWKMTLPIMSPFISLHISAVTCDPEGKLVRGVSFALIIQTSPILILKALILDKHDYGIFRRIELKSHTSHTYVYWKMYVF